MILGYWVDSRRYASILSIAFVLSFVVGFRGAGVPTVFSLPQIHQGDLILAGNNVTTIEGLFEVNGSIVVSENATLILKNAGLNLTQLSSRQFKIELVNPKDGRPRLMVLNSSIASKYDYEIRFSGNSTGEILQNSTLKNAYLIHGDSSSVFISNSSVDNSLWLYGSSFVNITDSSITEMMSYQCRGLLIADSHVYSMLIGPTSVNCSVVGLAPGEFGLWDFITNSSAEYGAGSQYPNVTIHRTTIGLWRFAFYGSSRASMDHSLLLDIYTFGTSQAIMVNSTAYRLYSQDDGAIYLVNSTFPVPYDIYGNGHIYLAWPLVVHVIDSQGQNVPSAEVTAVNPRRPSTSGLTNPQGRTTLILAEKIINATGEYSVGEHTVEAAYGAHSNTETVNMTGNKSVTIQLAFVVPEFPALLILPLFMMATLVAALASTSRVTPHRRAADAEDAQENQPL